MAEKCLFPGRCDRRAGGDGANRWGGGRRHFLLCGTCRCPGSQLREKGAKKWGGIVNPPGAITLTMFIAESQRVGEEGRVQIAMKGPRRGPNQYRHLLARNSSGCVAQAQKYLHERHQFGKPLAAFQALQFKLADMATELIAARQMVHLAAWKLDQQDPDATTYSAMAKRFATDAGFHVCNEALQIHGDTGISTTSLWAPCSRCASAPDPGRHKRNHACHHCPPSFDGRGDRSRPLTLTGTT